MAGLEICPTSNPLVKSSLEGAKRELSRSVHPKEPYSSRVEDIPIQARRRGGSRGSDEPPLKHKILFFCSCRPNLAPLLGLSGLSGLSLR